MTDVLESIPLPYGRLEYRRVPAPPTPPGFVPLADRAEPYLVFDLPSGGGERAMKLSPAQARRYAREAR